MAAPGCLFRVSYRHWFFFFLFFFLSSLFCLFSLLLLLLLPFLSDSSYLPSILLLLLLFSFSSEFPGASQSPRIINNTPSHPRSRTGSSLVPLFLLIPDWTRIRFQQIQHIGCAFLCFFLYSLLYIPLTFSFSFFLSLSSPEREVCSHPTSQHPGYQPVGPTVGQDCLRHPCSIELTNNPSGMLVDILFTIMVY